MEEYNYENSRNSKEKNNKRKSGKKPHWNFCRILSFILAIAMVIAAVPFSLFAEEEGEAAVISNENNSWTNTDNKASVTLNKAGSGSGTIVLVNSDSTQSTVLESYEDTKSGDFSLGEVTLTVTPDDNSFISSITVGGEDNTPADDSAKKAACVIPLRLNADLQIDVTFSLSPVNTVTVTKDEYKNPNEDAAYGNGGAVYIDGVETPVLEYKQGEGKTFALKVEPDSNHLIKSVSIGGEEQEIGDGKSFTKEVTIPAKDEITNTEIKVVFIKLYRFSVFKENGEGGVVAVNGENTGEGNFEKDFKYGESITVSVTPNDKHIFDLVLNNAKVEAENNEYTFTLDESTISNRSCWIKVNFIRLYTISVSSGENGTAIITQPDSAAGSVSVKVQQNEAVTITATPNEHYRVFSVSGAGTDYDGEFYDNRYTEESPLTIKYNWILQDYDIVITFAPMIFTVSATAFDNVQITNQQTAQVNYGEDYTLNIKYDEGYIIESITVRRGQNSETADLSSLVFTGENTVEYTVENITADTSIYVCAKVIEYADVSGFSWEKDKAIRINSETGAYIFKKGETVEFSTLKEGIKLYFADETSLGGADTKKITLNSDRGIKSIWLYYDNSWHEVRDNDSPIELGLVFDSALPQVTVAKPDNKTIYNGDVELTVNASETGENPSGISKVEYTVSGGDKTETGILYSYDESGQEEIKDSLEKLTFTVDSEKFNFDDIKVTVTVTDRAGNTSSAETNFSINTDRPKITISMDGNKLEGAEDGYFTSDRTALITVMDRDSAFKEIALEINITAKDKNGENIPLNTKAMISGWTKEGDNKHTALVTFTKEAVYSWSLSPYTNKAGNTAEVTVEGESPYSFTVDKTAPKLTLTSTAEGWSNTFEEIIKVLTFGIYKKSPIKTTAKAEDNISPLYNARYYKANADTVLDFKALEEIYKEGGFTEEPIIVNSDDEFVIYARVQDYAGNITYKNTDRMIFDSTESLITLTPDMPHSNDFYNKDFNVAVRVDEEKIPGTAYSGIKEITYKIIRDAGEREETVTKTGTLYSSGSEADAHKKQWEGIIPIIAADNNSDKVKVVVTAVDNAGNAYSSETDIMAVNVTPPEISITFGGDSAVNVIDERGYFNKSRTVTITVIDRNSAFDEEAMTKAIVISAVDAGGNEISLDTSKMISGWKQGKEKNQHIVTIVFSDEGNYSWSILPYVNKAGLSVKTTEDNKAAVDTKASVTPFSFTVDKSKPTGSLTIDKNTWDSLLEKLTFGIFKSKRVEISASGADTISPIAVEFYKTDKTDLLTELQLNKLYAERKFQKFADSDLEKNGVYPNERFTLYIRVTDYAGNYHYICSEGVILDSVPPGLTLIPDSPNANGKYNSDVNVKITVKDTEIYSGINTVKYWVECDGKVTQKPAAVSLYKDNSVYGDLKDSWTGNITVKSELNNSCDVIVYAEANDNAGNKVKEQLSLDIDITKPVITLSYEDKTQEGAREKYFTQRTATVVITERTANFDPKAATEGITVTARDKNGKEIENAFIIGNWVTNEGDAANEATHTADITFKENAYYTLSVSYTDKAGNTAEDVFTESKCPFDFVIDNTAPQLTLTSVTKDWTDIVKEVIDKLTFGLYSNDLIETVGEAEDNLSPLNPVEYYKAEGEALLEYKDLEKLYNKDSFVSEPFTVNADEEYVIYARVSDYAGNVTYMGTNLMIFDNTEGIIVLTPEKSNENGFYSKNFTVAVKVNEEKIPDTVYSGIREITYKIVRDNDNATQQGTLYPSVDHQYEPHLKEWEGEIKVDAAKNNSDNVRLYVTVIDNAGNEYTEKSDVFMINVTPPEISLSFDDNQPVKIVGEGEEQRGYFGKDRIATITITDRDSAFDGEAATNAVEVFVVDSKGNEIKLDLSQMISKWQQGESENQHIATVAFSQSGNYTWSIKPYTNKADITTFTEDEKAAVNTSDSVTPFTFTVDKEKPSGSVAVGKNVWEQFLERLTFGIFKSESIEVSAEGDDEISPVIVEYYKTSRTELISEERLEELYKNGEFSVFEGSDLEKEGVSPNQRFVIYIRVTDYGDNYIYIHSDGAVADDFAAKITLVPDAPNENGAYNKNITVKIAVDDTDPDTQTYSGINTVEYWVESGGARTQEETLFAFSVEDPLYEQLQSKWEGSVTVNSALNNYRDVMVYVKVTDNAGNESTESIALDIDVTKPLISLYYSDKSNAGAKEGYYIQRTATVVITERTDHFDAADATNGITIAAKNLKGTEIADSYSISEWKTTEGETADKAVHTAMITFTKDANYTLDIAYTDKAGNRAEGIMGEAFTVDTLAPAGVLTAKSAEGRIENYSGLHSGLTFGFWSRSKISISQSSEDLTSPIANVQYYMPVSENAEDDRLSLDRVALDKVTEWKQFDSLDIADNCQFVLYLKITDNAGNYCYISTNGLIVDNTHPDVESAAPMITVNPIQPVNNIYKGDVKVTVTVSDPLKNGTYSGLREITYKVFDKNSANPNTPTQEGTLFTFDNANPTQRDLVQSVTREITVDSRLNNSNDIQVVVYAVDNAGNTADNSRKNSNSYTSLKIDTTAPTINISYNNNIADSNTYFNADRRATITVTERNFNSDDVKVTVTNTDGVIPALSGWTNKTGTFNGDNSTHTAFVDYTADGDYTFKIEYTDMAGNKCTNIIYAAGTVAGEEFTLDKTKPAINVTYDNNNAQNNNYYKEERTATVVINEHNFNTDRIKISLTAADNGNPAAKPAVSGWTTVGDIHTATIRYAEDALYTFDISYTDMAGNQADVFTKETFFIDKQKPAIEITGVKDKSANKGDVMPVISLRDTNFDKNSVSVVLSGSNRGEDLDYKFSLEEIQNGEIISYENFPREKPYDDLYTLTVRLADMAGNESVQSITFSANRFGSVYDLSAVKELLNKYMRNEQDIVFIETNVNGLKPDSLKIKLTKNGIPTDLVSEEDYKVEKAGGDGEWSQYRYTINRALFADDGKYEIFIYSMDEAGNENENIDEVKDAEISFGIDKTNPVIALVDLENYGNYAVQIKRASVDIKDNLVLSDVKIYLNENEITYTVNGESYIFDIPQSNSRQTVRIVAKDAAGNQIEEIIEDILVSTNLFVRWYNNVPLFVGTIAGACAVIIGLVAFLLFGKRRKKEEKIMS